MILPITKQSTRRQPMAERSARDEWVDVFAALASAPRLQILEQLRRGPIRCEEMQSVVGLSQSAVSYHLARLERAGVLVKEKKGTRNCYRVHEALEGMLKQCTKGDGSWRIR
jgi:DNA-binding transcriptional ArsR family regulator